MTMAREEIIAWRKGERARLIAARVAVPDAARESWTQRIIASLESIVMAAEGPVSFFWPFRGEPNLRPLMRRMVAAGKVVALPVVVQQRHPLEFRPWTPGCTMELGVWNIPIPDTRERVTPRLLVAPVVGFDPERYRLGYGGGFYDRTLDKLRTGSAADPLAVGVAFSAQHVARVPRDDYDQPLDWIVTEKSAHHFASVPAEVIAAMNQVW